MKASELIEALKRAIAEHGDLPVKIGHEWKGDWERSDVIGLDKLGADSADSHLSVEYW